MSSAVSVPAGSLPAATASRVVVERNLALDFAKGALVLCMIAYHTINYFRYDPNLLRHLHFLPPSFIFLAGFLVTHVYLSKIRCGDSRVPGRLFIRGLKTVALFLVLNLLVQSLVSSSYNRNFGIEAFIGRLDIVLLGGEVRAAVFGVLLPIGYVLLLSAVVLLTFSFAPYALPTIAGLTLALCLVLAQQGRLPFNLDLVSMGLLGTAVGFVSRRVLDRAAGSMAILLAAYLGYTIAVRFQYPTYAMNLIGVTLSLLMLYAMGLRLTAAGRIGDGLRLLGNYSLLSYLVQIAFLQALFRVCRYFGELEGHVLVPALLTTLATFVFVKAVDVSRGLFPSVDRIYKAIFA